MDINIFWQQLGLYNPTSQQTQYALAVMADAYSTLNEQITDLSIFKTNKT